MPKKTPHQPALKITLLFTTLLLVATLAFLQITSTTPVGRLLSAQIFLDYFQKGSPGFDQYHLFFRGENQPPAGQNVIQDVPNTGTGSLPTQPGNSASPLLNQNSAPTLFFQIINPANLYELAFAALRQRLANQGPRPSSFPISALEQEIRDSLESCELCSSPAPPAPNSSPVNSSSQPVPLGQLDAAPALSSYLSAQRPWYQVLPLQPINPAECQQAKDECYQRAVVVCSALELFGAAELARGGVKCLKLSSASMVRANIHDTIAFNRLRLNQLDARQGACRPPPEPPPLADDAYGLFDDSPFADGGGVGLIDDTPLADDAYGLFDDSPFFNDADELVDNKLGYDDPWGLLDDTPYADSERLYDEAFGLYKEEKLFFLNKQAEIIAENEALGHKSIRLLLEMFSGGVNHLNKARNQCIKGGAIVLSTALACQETYETACDTQYSQCINRVAPGLFEPVCTAPPPVGSCIAIEAVPLPLFEGDSAYFIVTIRDATGAIAAAPSDVIFRVSTEDDVTAVAPADYDSYSGSYLILGGGTGLRSPIVIPIKTDEINDPNEEIEVYLSNSNGLALCTGKESARMTIYDRNQILDTPESAFNPRNPINDGIYLPPETSTTGTSNSATPTVFTPNPTATVTP